MDNNSIFGIRQKYKNTFDKKGTQEAAREFAEQLKVLETKQGEAFSMPTTITELSKYFDAPVGLVREKVVSLRNAKERS